MTDIDDGTVQVPRREANQVRVAVCQTAHRIDDPQGSNRYLKALQQATSLGAQVIVLPELVASGYMFNDKAELRHLARVAAASFLPRLIEFAAQHDVIVVAGLPEEDCDRVYNSAVLVDPRGVRVTYRKVHLWDREKTVGFTAGCDAPPVVRTQHGRIGLMICYDAEFPEWVRRAALDGADMLCIPVNWPLFPRPAAERPSEIVKIQANAAVNRVYIAVADRVAPERGQEWLGGSVIVDPDGFPITKIDLGRPSVSVADVTMSLARNKAVSANNDVFGDRRTEVYDALRAAPRTYAS